MPEMSGFDVYFELSKLGKKILTVLITAYRRRTIARVLGTPELSGTW
ncbi:hypothetical protein EAV90_38810 [Bradyrhizobium vignae]|nr:hypothetical protein EAV90_38810 [Bradyrhizobium vignae]